MADISRDTFRLTNVMHELLTGEAVSDPRHYVGVRLQQGVPLLDADWNEKDDIHRQQNRIHLKQFLGDGIPSDSNGFHIGPVTEGNDFAIADGMAMVDGMLVVNHHSGLTYLGQAAALGVTVDPIAPPASGTREDLVYLDVWEEEVDPTGVPNPDDRLINPRIGVETCVRLERRWRVSVAEGPIELSEVPQEPGHSYLSLARLRRTGGADLVSASSIFDLRRIDMNVAKYLKIPLYVERAGAIVDSDRLAQLLDILRTTYLARLAASRLFIEYASPPSAAIVQFAVEHILQICSTGGLQARTFNLTTENAVEVLSTLIAAQQGYLDVLPEHGTAGAPQDAFVSEYQTRLDAVSSARDTGDLLDTYRAQQDLNAWLAADVGTAPEGSVSLQFVAVDPAEPLVAGSTYRFFVEITSGVTSDQTSEVFDVTASLSSALWQITPETTEVTLGNVGEPDNVQTLEFEVIPNAANAVSDLNVVAQARRNTTVQSSQLPLALEIGVQPLTGNVLLYAGPPLNPQGRLELSAASLTSGFGTSVGFALSNSGSSSQEYTVEWFITLTDGDETNWTPLSASPASTPFTVAADSTQGIALNITAPTGGTVTGNEGTLHASLLIGGVEQETLDIDFVAV